MNNVHLDHSEIEQLLGVYALDAVGEPEHSVVEEHLKQCDSCRSEVAMHVEAIGAAVGSTQYGPPAGLWDKIAGSLEAQPPPFNVATLAPAPAGGKVVALKWVASLAGIAAAIAGVLGLKVADQDRKIDELAAAVRENSIVRIAAAVSADPSAQRIVLRSKDEATVARVVVLPDGTGYIVQNNLRGLPASSTYQLWALVGDQRISLGVLGNHPDVIPFRMVGSAAGFAITQEAAGGVPLTKKDPVVVGFSESPQ